VAGYHVLEETLAGHSLQLRPVTGAHPVIIAIGGNPEAGVLVRI
jgi:hypothetical protein